MSSSLKTMLASALVAFAFSIGANIGIGPSTAWAQTATDLDCKKCVKRKAIRKGVINFQRLQGKVRNRITALESARTALEAAAAERVPFYITLDGDGAEQTIATNGALEYFVRCTVDPIGGDNVQIIATSTVGGWFGVEDNGSRFGPLLAGDEEVVLEPQGGITTNPVYDQDIDGTSAAAPDGSYISIDGETVGLGLNIFGHDCLAVGNVFLITGTP